jgi:hypothetical protein
MAPVVGFKLSPAGREGLTPYAVAAPPLFVGVFARIGVPIK